MRLKKYGRGPATAVATVALTLLVGLLPFAGSSAFASPTDSASPTTSSTTSGTPTTTTVVLPNAAAASAYSVPGQTTTVNVLAHSSCNGSTTPPCAVSALVAPIKVVGPAGITHTVQSNGTISLAVASTVTPGTTATLTYTIADKYGSSHNDITLNIGHPPVAPVIYKTIWTGHAITFDLLSTAKCDDLQSPCLASSIKKIIFSGDRNNPYTTATVSPAGMVTIIVRTAQNPFTHARFPYVLVDKYGSSHVGYVVVSFLDFFTPTNRVIFNNPLGGWAQQQSIDIAVTDLIKHAPPGALIQMSSYILESDDIANALVAARKRGVFVRVLGGSFIIGPQVPWLRSVLGANPRAANFYWICKWACRSGTAGQPHSKVMSVSQSGRGKNIVLAASSNFSYTGSRFQWFDAYESVGDVSAYNAFSHVFNEQRAYTRPTDWTGVAGGSPAVSFLYPRIIKSLSEMRGIMPKTVTAPAHTAGDWIQAALSQVGCHAATGFGRNGRTLVRVDARAIAGARGFWIVQQLGQLAKAGCDVRVIESESTGSAVAQLQQSGIPVVEQSWSWQQARCTPTTWVLCWNPLLYSHMHALMVSGRYGTAQQQIVWTASESWNETSYWDDEQVVKITGASTFNSYLSMFNYAWAHYTHTPGQKPTGRP